MALIVALVLAGPAAATLPGRNGPIGYSMVGGKAEYTYSGVSLHDTRTTADALGNVADRELAWAQADASGGGFVSGVAFDRRGRLAYSAVQVPSHYELMSLRGPGSLGLVAPNGDSASVELAVPSFQPTWSPDGKRLIVTRYGAPDRSTPNLFLIDADGRDLGQVTTAGGADADWASTGAIAYVDDGDIWVTGLGEQPRRLTFRGGASPSWAPSGRRIAFVRDGNVWSVGSRGKGVRRLTRLGGREPAWSPDGRRIAFVRYQQMGGRSLFVMLADGRRAHSLPTAVDASWGGIAELAWKPLRR